MGISSLGMAGILFHHCLVVWNDIFHINLAAYNKELAKINPPVLC